MPMRSRPVLLMALVWLMPAVVQAGAWPHHWRVTELQPNEPVVGGVWYRTGSLLDRGMNLGDGYVALYVVEAEPGAQYTLQLKAPHSLKRIRAYVFDRWPGTAGVHSTPLPTGPAMIPAHARYVTYRWRVGVSARSRGNLLYLLVRYPQDPGRRTGLAPRIVVFSPPISPTQAIGHGVTYLQGPGGLMLADDAAMMPSMSPGVAPGRFGDMQPGWAPTGDLISNGTFAAGLKDWNPVRAGRQEGTEPRVDADGLRLFPDTGVSQQLDADVAHDDALVLWADVRIGRTPHAQGSHPALTLAVCYRDGLGHRRCGDQAYRSVIYAGRMPVATEVGPERREAVPIGHWYRFRANLMQISPTPVHIESISLRGPAHAGSAWIREVHLLPEESNATH